MAGVWLKNKFDKTFYISSCRFVADLFVKSTADSEGGRLFLSWYPSWYTNIITVSAVI